MANGDDTRYPSKYYYLAKLDGIMDGSGDWALVNNAALLVSIKPHRNHAIRVGFTDNLLYVPGSGYKGNIAAGLLACRSATCAISPRASHSLSASVRSLTIGSAAASPSRQDWTSPTS